MRTMYRTDRSRVTAHEVVSAGDKWITQADGTREARFSQFAEWFETEAEAIARTRVCLRQRIDMLTSQLAGAELALSDLA